MLKIELLVGCVVVVIGSVGVKFLGGCLVSVGLVIVVSVRVRRGRVCMGFIVFGLCCVVFC